MPLLEAMSSTNWSTRHESINDLLTIVNTKPRVLSAQSVKVRARSLFIGYLNECPIMQFFGIPSDTAKFQAQSCSMGMLLTCHTVGLVENI